MAGRGGVAASEERRRALNREEQVCSLSVRFVFAFCSLKAEQWALQILSENVQQKHVEKFL